jgi:hypothetical protein
MNKEDIIKMAREAGGLIYEVDWCFEMENLERFFQAAYAAGAATEREACAKVCEDIDTEYEGQDVLATWCATAIRARGQA